MTCRDTLNLLPLFFDGELDARQMRSVALHSSRCPMCEAELRSLERIQELVGAAINNRVDELDLSNLWTAIEPRLASTRRGWWQRFHDWWQELEAGWAMRIPALGVAVAVAVLAVLFFTRTREPGQVTPTEQPMIAGIQDDVVRVDELECGHDCSIIRDEGNSLLWVSDDSSIGSR